MDIRIKGNYVVVGPASITTNIKLSPNGSSEPNLAIVDTDCVFELPNDMTVQIEFPIWSKLTLLNYNIVKIDNYKYVSCKLGGPQKFINLLKSDSIQVKLNFIKLDEIQFINSGE